MAEAENINPNGLVDSLDEVVIDEATKRMLIKNFFYVNKAKFPSWFGFYIRLAYFTFATGILFIVYFNKNLFSIMFGTICLILTFIFVRKWLSPYRTQKKLFEQLPSADIIDDWLIEDIKNIIRPKAIDALSLDETKLKPENFIIVPYPIFWNVGGIEEEFIKRNQTGEEHFKYSIHKIQVLALTENYISMYTCVFNWIDLTISGENTNEFFYHDISSIKNDMEKIQNKPFFFEENPEEGIVFQGLSAKIFSIRNMSGEVLSLITDIPEMHCSSKISANLNQVIQVLRVMLRNRRYGETYQPKMPKVENPETHEKH